MRNFLVLILCILALPKLALALEWEDQRTFNAEANGPRLKVLSSTDTAVFSPIIDAFVADNPSTSVEYFVTSTAEVDRLFRETPRAFDLVISSAMDLQLKLANDGLGLKLKGVSAADWTHWRRSLFAFTAEPAAIVINREAFDGQTVPQTRRDLIGAMRARPEVFRGRIGTYDIRRSGLGYLFATQDARSSETYWRLMEVFGGLEVQLYSSSGAMIDDLATGKLAVAYNVLGSYAAARTDAQRLLDIILPANFPTTMMRTALVSKSSSQPEAASAFVRHLITLRDRAPQNAWPLPLLAQSGLSDETSSISLEPALMTFLDALKRRQFTAEWENAVIQGPIP